MSTRPFERKAIFIVGPSSCGKTTTCDALANHYRIPPSRHIKEVARTVMRTQGFSRKDVGTFEMQKAILDGQLNAEKIPRDVENQDFRSPILFLSDRSALDPVVYIGLEGNEVAITMEEKLLASSDLQQTISFYRRHSLFVLLPFVKEWVYDDGVRSLDVRPDKFSHRLHELLERFKIPYIEIPESIRDLQSRVDLIDKTVGEP